MSTRATYRFFKDKFPLVTFYIHHDGYPRGAAEYIKACVTEFGSLSADLFVRNNDRAEIITSPEAYGDINFHYDIDLDENTVKVSEYQENKSRCVHGRPLLVVHQGNVFEWINSQITEDKLIQVKPRYGNPYYTSVSVLKKKLNNKEADLKEYKSRFPHDIGNISVIESEVNSLRQMIR